MNQEECICALATPAGGAIGIIRLSGSDAITLTDKIFQSANGKSLEEAKPYTLHYGEIKDKDGNTIDDVLVSVFRAPHSYTGENSTEISCHGSRYILQQVLHRFTEVGCRQAEPGEYTRRAYLNGKMDLSQAEAVADLIASTNKATHKMALSQLKGHFSNELSLLREKLLKMTSLLELELDFSDHEELEFADRSELQALAEEINHKITTLAHSFETGNALKQGVAVAIVGKTNVGKSTLLNRLLHEEKAIVSDIHGTTRDVIEDTTLIDGITFRFIDTAGIRKTDDVVENIGIERTFQAVSIPVMAKCRIGHFAEAQILQAIEIDYIDESEVLSPADNVYHIDKTQFDVPFVCGAKNLGEALRRIAEGATMIRTKGEPGTGDVVQAVTHMRMMQSEIRRLVSMSEDELYEAAKQLQAPYDLVKYVHENGKLPVVNFAAGGVATPADAALMMQLGAEGVFVGSGIFKSGNPAKRAQAIVKAVTNYNDPKMLAELSEDLGEAMVGINEQEIALLMAERGK